MNRILVLPVVLVLVVVGCSGGPDNGRAAKPDPAQRMAASWSTTLAGSPGGLASDRGGAIVSVDNDSVVALDPDGRERWTAAVAGAGLGWPLLGDGLVVVPTLRDESGPGGCVALSRSTGARVWTYEEESSQGVAVVRAGNDVVCALGNGVIVALDRVTGDRHWRAVVAADQPRSAVSIPERTALAVDGATRTLAVTVRVWSGWIIARLDLESGADAGGFVVNGVGPVSAPVSIEPGRLAVGVSDSSDVCVLDLRSRRIGPCVATPTPDGFDPASIPLLADGLVVIAGRDGSVTAIDLAAKTVRWSVHGPNPILGARPVVIGGIVMFNDWTRVPWALRLADGSSVEVPKFDGWVVSTVADDKGGFEVAKRDMHGGWIERWVPVT